MKEKIEKETNELDILNEEIKKLEEIEVREIEVGITPVSEIIKIVDWFWSQQSKTLKMFPSNVVSKDNEELKISLYDVYRMAGRFSLMAITRVIAKELEKVSSEKPAQLVGVEDVNESFPVVIRLLPKKAKKARKKKKSGRVLTHDEQVEGQCGSEPGSRDGIFLIFQMNSIICCTFEYVIQSKGEECKNTNDF